MNSGDESVSCQNPADTDSQNLLLEFLHRAEEILRKIGGSERDFEHDLMWLKQRHNNWKKHSWQLALIGITSSGKSTFINALMGSHLLPTAVPPSSNVIVCCQRGAEGETTCKIHYKDKPEPEELRGSLTIQHELANLADERNNPHNLRHVDQIDLFSPSLEFQENVILIDTPGLDAYGLEFHETLTLENLLPTVDVVVFLQAMIKPNSGEQTRKFLQTIHKADKPLVYVLTGADSVVPKPDFGGRVKKTIDEIKDECKTIARKMIGESGFPVESTPIIRVSALLHLNGDKENSGMLGFVSAVREHLAQLTPHLINGRFQQLTLRLNKIAEANSSNSDIGYSREQLELQRNQLTAQHVKYRSILSSLDDSLERILEESKARFTKLIDAAEKLRNSESDLEKAEDIQRRLVTAARADLKALSLTIPEVEKAIKDLAEELNLKPEDVTFTEIPTRRIPRITVPEKAMEVDSPGFFAEVFRFFGAGGRHEEKQLVSKLFRIDIKKSSVEHRNWMKHDAIPEILSNAKNRTSVIEDEIRLQFQKLDIQKQSHLTSETRQNVANAIKALLAEMPGSYNTPEKHASYHDSSSTETVWTDISVHPITDLMRQLATRVSEHRLLALREKSLELVSKRTCFESARRVLIFGFDTDSIERFLTHFWSDFPEVRMGIELSYLELAPHGSFQSVAVSRHATDTHLETCKQVGAFLSSPATIFLIVDLPQPGSAKNHIAQSHILDYLHRDVGFVIVIQSVNWLLNAETLAEGVLHLWEEVKRHELKVDAILANSKDVFLSTALDALFEVASPNPTTKDAMRLQHALQPKTPKERKLLEQILRGWNAYTPFN
ncbi:MAG: dynamin family protein [bacterium]